jgi:hypothetical protein
MRQRLLWTVFYLERNLAFTYGYPYFLRGNDIKVPFPDSYDDRQVFPDRPLPSPACNGWSPISNLIALVQWNRLAAEIWDNMFAVNRQRATDPELVAIMDARILHASKSVPPFLQNHSPSSQDGLSGDHPPFTWHQSAILQLVS